MAKRTSKDRFSMPFYRNLTPIQKLLWDYINARCDHAGIWDVNLKEAQDVINCQEKFDSSILKAFNWDRERIVAVTKGRKWFLTEYIVDHWGNNPNKLKAPGRISAVQKLIGLGIKPDHYGIIYDEAAKNSSRKKVKAYSELDRGTFYPVERLAKVYANDLKLMAAVSGTTKKSINDIKQLLPLFVEEITAQGRATESPDEFAKYFRHWVKSKRSGVISINSNKTTRPSMSKYLSQQELFTMDNQEAEKAFQERWSQDRANG